MSGSGRYDGELAELKAAEEVFERPEHPYTPSLVDSAFTLRRPAAQEHRVTVDLVRMS